MDKLLTLHPDLADIGETQLAKTLKYANLDVNGNVIECFARKTTDEPFVDITEAEQTRKTIAEYDLQLRRLQRTANKYKERESDYAQENNITDRND